jgi:uncharacterized protein
MHVAELWRFPVKSMAGERLAEVEVRPDGLAGDRLVRVRDARGRVITSRTRPELLAHVAVLGGDGQPLVDGRPWSSPEVADAVRRAAGPDAVLERFDGLERFDVLPLLVATDGAIASFGHDGRRLRPNIVVGGVDGLAERGWEGRRLRVGPVLIGVRDLRQRCVMTTYDPDTQAQDVSILRGIVERFGGCLALNCEVLQPGRLRAGDAVELL